MPRILKKQFRHLRIQKVKSKKLTHKELLCQLDYDYLTGIFTRKISNCNSVKIGDIAGTKTSEGYIHICVNKITYLAHRLAWFYYYGYMPENGIDHKDRIKHHNWIKNLREATHQCNARNTGNSCINTSGVKGVYWNKNRNKWDAAIKINGKLKYLGRYKDFDEAVCHRLAAEQCLDWEGCDSNSSAYQYVKDQVQSGLPF